MALDTRQKRMSALHPASPWRGPMVDATETGFTAGNRQAADFLYSGIEADSGEPEALATLRPVYTRRRR